MTFRLALLLLTACAPAEWVRDYDGVLPGTHRDRERVAAILVRDGRTGLPVAGARVRWHDEGWPTPDGEWAGFLGETQTDAYGLAWVEFKERPGSSHWVVEAPGFATAVVYGRCPNTTVDLEAGRTMRGRLIGPTGKPLRGVRVDYKIGCAHAPRLRSATTSADGVFVFEHAVDDADVTYEAPGIAAGYASMNSVAALPAAETYAKPGATVRGSIRLADGSAPRGGVLQNLASARGPLVKLRSDGSFETRSAILNESWVVYLDSGSKAIKPFEWRAGGVFTYRVDAPEPPDIHAVTMNIRDRSEHFPLRVRCERIDGGGQEEWVGWSGTQIWLRPGRYRAIVGDRFSEFTGESLPFSVPGTDAVTIGAVRRAPLMIEWEQPELALGPAQVHLKGDFYWWEYLEGEWEYQNNPFLAPNVEAVLTVERDGVRHFFPIPCGEVRRVRVRMPDRKRLALPDADDPMLSIHDRGSQSDPAYDPEAHTVETRATGDVAVVMVNEKELCVLRYRLPERDPGAAIEPWRVDRHARPAAGSLFVSHPDGTAAAWVRVTLHEDSIPPLWRGYVKRELVADKHGRVSSPWLRAGAAVLVGEEDSEILPRHVVLVGEAPYRVNWGDCSLRVDLRDCPDGSAIVLDGRIRRRLLPDVHILRGLDPGVHTLIVGAPTRRSQIHRIVLQPGEERVIDAQLPSR